MPQDIVSESTKSWIEDIVAKYHILGIAITAVKGGTKDMIQTEILTYGKADGHGNLVTEDSLFAIASSTKLSTAIAIGLLIHRQTPTAYGGVLAWDTRVRDVTPKFCLKDEDVSSQVTLTDLMARRTGLACHQFATLKESPEITLVMQLEHLRLSQGLREKWTYNNHMWGIAHLLVKRFSPGGLDLPDFVKDEILDPLGMNDTYYDMRKAKATGRRTDVFIPGGFGEGAICGDWFDDGDGLYMSAFGGVVMSPKDMGRWLVKLNDPAIIPSEVIDRCSTPIIETGSKATYPELGEEEYGLGQFCTTYRGHRLVFSHGTHPETFSLVYRLPHEGISVSVMLNVRENKWARCKTIAFRLIDEMLGLDTIDWEARLLVTTSIYSEGATRHEAELRLEEDSTNCSVNGIEVGKYFHPGYGELHIRSLDPNRTDHCSVMNDYLANHHQVSKKHYMIAHVPNHALITHLLLVPIKKDLYRWFQYSETTNRLVYSFASGTALWDKNRLGMFEDWTNALPISGGAVDGKVLDLEDEQVWFEPQDIDVCDLDDTPTYTPRIISPPDLQHPLGNITCGKVDARTSPLRSREGLSRFNGSSSG